MPECRLVGLGGLDPANCSLVPDTLAFHPVHRGQVGLVPQRVVVNGERVESVRLQVDAALREPCPNQQDGSDPGCGVGGSNSLAWDTPIWDALFKTVDAEDQSNHLLSIHNNECLYNYSQPWVSHFSLQHTHNKPKDLRGIYGIKPFMYDEVKYEGRLSSNWGSFSAPQMVQRFW